MNKLFIELKQCESTLDKSIIKENPSIQNYLHDKQILDRYSILIDKMKQTFNDKFMLTSICDINSITSYLIDMDLNDDISLQDLDIIMNEFIKLSNDIPTKCTVSHL